MLLIISKHSAGFEYPEPGALCRDFWRARCSIRMLYAAVSATELAALEGFKLSTEACFGLWRVMDDDFNHQSGFSWFGNSRTRCTVAIFWRARSAVDT